MAENKEERLQLRDVRVSEVDLRAVPWRSVIEGVEDRKIDDYSWAFFKAATAAHEANELQAEHVYVLLGCISSMFYDHDDLAEPLKPVFQGPSGRSAAVTDFEGPQLDPLASILPEIEDDEMRARIGDVLWLRRREHSAARIASAAYLASAKRLMDPKEWVNGFYRLNRAMQLGAAIGRTSDEFAAASEYANELLSELASADPLYLSRSLIQMLIDHRAGEPKELAEIAKQCALNALAQPDPMRAGVYFACQVQCLQRAGDSQGARQALIDEAEAYASLGEAMAASGQKGLAADHWVEVAVQILRQAGGMQERCNQLIKRLHELRRLQMENMGVIQTSVPIDPKLIQHLDSAKGMKFEGAVAFIGSLARPLKVAEVRQGVLDQQRETPVATLFQGMILRDDGKVDCVIPSLPIGEEPSEEVFKSHMWRRLAMTRPMIAWMIEYVRKILTEEHPEESWSTDWLLVDNSFVPADRIALFERALRAGLHGDFTVSTHLLLPQLENSFRFVLNQHGIITTFLKPDGSQDEHPLERLLPSQEFADVFGSDLTFELRGLLTERAGNNLRNATAHGLKAASAFDGGDCIVLWALSIFLLLHGVKTEGKESEG